MTSKSIIARIDHRFKMVMKLSKRQAPQARIDRAMRASERIRNANQ